MFETIFSKITELYSSFVAMPVEYQIVFGIGTFVTFMSLKSFWGFIKPARFLTASTLNGVAFIIYPKQRSKVTQISQPTGAKTRNSKQDNDILGFPVSTEREFRRAYRKLAGTMRRARLLSETQLYALRELASLYNLKARNLYQVSKERRNATEAARLVDKTVRKYQPQSEPKNSTITFSDIVINDFFLYQDELYQKTSKNSAFKDGKEFIFERNQTIEYTANPTIVT